jgi:glycine dehydrogenase subunit 2
MVDFGIDAFWMSHEPRLVPEPFTPEAGELWSKEDIDYWIDVLEAIIAEAYDDPETVRTAPHNHPIHKVDGSGADDPERWATTWRAHQRKQAAPTAV